MEVKNIQVNIFFGIKKIWHECHAFLSGFKILILGNKAEKAATKGRLFEVKFINQLKYVRRLKKLPINIRQVGKYTEVKIKGNVYYWPSTANINSLMVVLAEALLPDHPHYYDSAPTKINTGDRVLDIGACEGAFTLHASARECNVIAVEPSQIMIEAIKLAASHYNFRSIKYVLGLISSVNTEVGFYENINSPETSMIVDKEQANEYRKCWTLDSFIEEFFPEGIDFIKCDAEGADYEILKSGRKSLAKYKPKLAIASYHHYNDFKKMQNLLEEIGYNVVGQGLFYSPILHKCFPLLLKAY